MLYLLLHIKKSAFISYLTTRICIWKKLLEAYVDIVTEAMSHNEEIVLIGFGTLIPRPQTERLARNPKTGTPVMIPARTTVKFKPGKYLLDAINKPEEKK